MNNNTTFTDIIDRINNKGYEYNFKNGIEWAFAAQRNGEISWSTYKQYENVHSLRVRMAHGNARDINVSDETLRVAKQYERDINRSRVRGSRENKRKDGPILPPGTFRDTFTKEFNWDGKNGRNYYFRFFIVKEYQEREYDDGTRFSGTGFTIYVKSAPYMDWCLDHNRDMEFHFYDYPKGNPSICWNKLITSFQDANAVMFVWAKRYVKILDQLLDDNKVDFNRVEKARKTNILPTGTFRKNHFHRKTVHIDKSVYDEIMNLLGTKKPELGGMLGWKDDQDYIDYFVFDKDAVVGNSAYSPNTEYLSSIINGEWREKRIYIAGFVHSHPRDAIRLSEPDIEYAQRIMRAFGLNYLFMPIVTSSFGYKQTFNPYIISLDGRVSRCNIKIISNSNQENENTIDLDSVDFNEIEKEFEMMSNVKPIYSQDINEHLSNDDVFARISNVIDVDYMRTCSIIGFGCGGAKSFYESMARVGVGNFYLMDGDVSSLSNIASQNGYLSEVGLFKVDALKKRLLDINNSINVSTFNVMLDNSINDSFLEENIISKVNKDRSLICSFTDDFYAQARASRIAIKYGIPFICGQHYEKGIASELIFWYPGITKYSLREITKSRYDSYQNGYKNDVTSVGSPIFNTTRLNAICEKIATGLLLFNGYPNSIYSRFLVERNDKNLILVRQNYIDENNRLYDLFENTINTYFDDVAWINPETIEDLNGQRFEEEVIIDTRNIF